MIRHPRLFRLFSTSRLLRSADGAAHPTPNLGSNSVQKKPLGAFRGGVVGFLLGFSLASSYAAYRLVDEYKQASALLQASVEELQATATKASGFHPLVPLSHSSEQVSTHLKRIEAVEKDLKALSETTVPKDDVTKLRVEVKKLYDGLHIEFLDLRSHVWGIQQDVQALSKKERSSVRLV
ncbi:hypothetical protein BDM02DRAFT_620120 [Thelephora ganbajun]|uniref:Uncharacterized protein n=1 Tax=Thelephora ganbajun TaxID=370292 RepID=A0ACB6ZP07_THEGA|nr:hypothetical protein BDM02DRAFT_620120 [Thelephora ganbajun]